MQTYDVIVIGLGAMGSAASYHLACRGARVLGLDQFDIPNTMGSSHGQSRMIRTAYYEHPDYVPLLQRAWQRWRELETEAGQQILYPTGGLYLGPAGGELIAGSLASSRRHGLAHALLSFEQVKSRYPQFHIPPHWVGLFEHQAGFVRPERAIAAHAQLAARRDAAICAHEAVLSWKSDAGGVTVSTSKATYAAGELVICGGAWSAKLLRDIATLPDGSLRLPDGSLRLPGESLPRPDGSLPPRAGSLPPLRVSRQVLGWVRPPRPEPFRLGALPVWAADNLDGTIHYGFPILEDGRGMKLAHHGPGAAADPDTLDRAPRAGDEQSFRPLLKRLLPGADGPLAGMQICMYTSSPDHHFILDRPPQLPHVTLACGFSGHGFKFAAVIGEALADLALNGRSDLPIGFLGLRRFGRNAER